MPTLKAAKEIALRSILINSILTKDAGQSMENLFMDGGETRLAECSVRLASLLVQLRAALEPDFLLVGLSDLEPTMWAAELVCGMPPFVGRHLSTCAHLVNFYLCNEFQYVYADGFSFEELKAASFWDALNGESQSVNFPLILPHIQRRFKSGVFPQLLDERFIKLKLIGDELVEKASHIPFGSLAQAISKKLGIVITLWPMDGMERAARMQRVVNGLVEEIILYEPCSHNPSSLDFETRYAVAHELAHIALRHKPHTYPETAAPKIEEIEAHCLAAIFLRFHGAPTGRTQPQAQELVEILRKTDLPQADLSLIVQRILASGNPAARDNGPALAVDAFTEVKEAIQQFVTDADFRQQVERDFAVGI